jgi:hypothetical protein
MDDSIKSSGLLSPGRTKGDQLAGSLPPPSQRYEEHQRLFKTYLQEKGVTDAIAKIVSSLLSRDRLPSNPHIFVVEQLRRLEIYKDMKAQVVQEKEQGQAIPNNVLKYVDPANPKYGICQVQGDEQFWGAAPVMGILDTEALGKLFVMLKGSETRTHGIMRSSTENKNGYNLRTICCLYGPAIFYGALRPQLDAITIHEDVIITGYLVLQRIVIIQT